MEALALSLAALNRLEAVFPQSPIEPAPRTNQDKVPVRVQNPRYLGRVQSALPLGYNVEEAVWEGEVPRVAVLESNAALRVEADFCHRGFDCLERGVDTAYARRGELAGQEEHAVAQAAFDLKHAFGSIGDMQNRGSECDERRRGHRPII